MVLGPLPQKSVIKYVKKHKDDNTSARYPLLISMATWQFVQQLQDNNKEYIKALSYNGFC